MCVCERERERKREKEREKEVMSQSSCRKKGHFLFIAEKRGEHLALETHFSFFMVDF